MLIEAFSHDAVAAGFFQAQPPLGNRVSSDSGLLPGNCVIIYIYIYMYIYIYIYYTIHRRILHLELGATFQSVQSQSECRAMCVRQRSLPEQFRKFVTPV